MSCFAGLGSHTEPQPQSHRRNHGRGSRLPAKRYNTKLVTRLCSSAVRLGTAILFADTPRTRTNCVRRERQQNVKYATRYLFPPSPPPRAFARKPPELRNAADIRISLASSFLGICILPRAGISYFERFIDFAIPLRALRLSYCSKVQIKILTVQVIDLV